MTTTPEQLQSMVAPGQEDALDEFLKELEEQNAALADEEEAPNEEAPGEPALLAGKFKTREDLERGYLELQRKLGERGQGPGAEGSSAAQAGPTPDQYTPELGKQLYGDTVAAAIEAAQINPLEMAEKLSAGQDVTGYVDALAEKGGLPRVLIETYLAGVAPAKPSGAAAQTLTQADEAELKAMVGGDQGFQALSRWAAANLQPDELADYNAAVDSGNKAAARFAIRQLQARATGGEGEKREPRLIGGGAPITGDVFTTDQQAVDARAKRGKDGRNLYETDPSYRSWYEKTLSRSKVFV